MFVIRNSVRIHAPIERCFALSTSLAIVARELRMHPVPGTSRDGHPFRTSGLVTAGDRVRWQGWQLGLPQHHVSLIQNFQANVFFQDKMISGRFRHFEHDHHFRTEHDQTFHTATDPTAAADPLAPPATILDDEIRFSLHFGLLGRLAARFILLPHIRRLLARRFRLIKRIAESEEWRQYLST